MKIKRIAILIITCFFIFVHQITPASAVSNITPPQNKVCKEYTVNVEYSNYANDGMYLNSFDIDKSNGNLALLFTDLYNGYISIFNRNGKFLYSFKVFGLSGDDTIIRYTDDSKLLFCEKNKDYSITIRPDGFVEQSDEKYSKENGIAVGFKLSWTKRQYVKNYNGTIYIYSIPDMLNGLFFGENAQFAIQSKDSKTIVYTYYETFKHMNFTVTVIFIWYVIVIVIGVKIFRNWKKRRLHRLRR
ncbi:MAG: hypothetical protein K6F76_07435 [Clostridiales bacterium]|nr:hypothetical protein [Clostridiales bacterium]